MYQFDNIIRRRKFFERLMPMPWICLGLVALMILIYAGMVQFHGSNFGVTNPSRGGYVGGLVTGGEWFRLINAGLHHSSLTHLAMNSFGLILFGWRVEAALGTARTVLLLFLSSVLGYTLFHLAVGNTEQVLVLKVVGSSAAAWGLIGGVVILGLRSIDSFPVFFRGKECTFPIAVFTWFVILLQILDQLRIWTEEDGSLPGISPEILPKVVDRV